MLAIMRVFHTAYACSKKYARFWQRFFANNFADFHFEKMRVKIKILFSRWRHLELATPAIVSLPFDFTSDYEYMNASPACVPATVVPKFVWCFLWPWARHFTLNCSMVRRSCKAVRPMYTYLNVNTRVHVKEHQRLFKKSRGSSRYCWLYFETTFIYSIGSRVWGKGDCGPLESLKISTACLYAVR